MKQIIFLAAVLLAGIGYSQNKPVGGDKWIVFKPEFIKQVTQVKAGPAISKDTFRFVGKVKEQLISPQPINKCTDKNHWVIKECKSLASPEPGKIRFERWDGENQREMDSIINIVINPVESKWIGITTTGYKFTFDHKRQVERNGDTLTIIDKTIRFIVVDGVTYEIVRNIEVRKLEPSGSIITWPHTSVRLYTPNN